MCPHNFALLASLCVISSSSFVRRLPDFGGQVFLRYGLSSSSSFSFSYSFSEVGASRTSDEDEHEEDESNCYCPQIAPINTEYACAMKERRRKPPDKERRRHQKQVRGQWGSTGGQRANYLIPSSAIY